MNPESLLPTTCTCAMPAKRSMRRPRHRHPQGHVGPVLLSDTGRTVWWTGRVAIGLRYQPPQHTEFCGQSALWVQSMLLRCA